MVLIRRVFLLLKIFMFITNFDHISLWSNTVWRLTLQGCHDQIRHLRDTSIKDIFCIWPLSVMSSKDFKLGLIVIEKFKFSQGSLKNVAHQVSDKFYFITFTTVNWFFVTIAYFDRLRKTFENPHCKLKSIEFWPRYGIKQFRYFLILRICDPHFQHSLMLTTIIERAPCGRHFQGCHGQIHHLMDISIKEVLGPMILAIQEF